MDFVFRKDRLKEQVTIYSGEYHTASTDRLIHTVLGSCVAVCLKDEQTNVAGMNHFMLPKDDTPGRIIATEAGRYGIHAMELLINEMLLRGAAKHRMWAKVFGGGRLLKLGDHLGSVPDANVGFAMDFLEAEQIPVLARDTGGQKGRRVTFFTKEGKVLVEPISGVAVRPVAAGERRFAKKLKTIKPAPAVELFD